MQGKIALEEHFAITETLLESKPFVPADYWPELEHRLTDIHITVSGNFSTHGLLATMSVVGAGRIMFATDWPFENIDHAADWFDQTPIAPADRLRIGRTNAVDLFKLDKHLARS